MRLLPVLILSLLLSSEVSKGQSKYGLSYPADISIGAAGVGMLTAGYFLGRKADGYQAEMLATLNREDIWKVDRHATFRWSPKSAIASDVVMYSSIVLPSLLFINKDIRKERYVSLLYAEALVLNMGLTALIKELAQRKRPFMYNPDAPMDKKLQKDAMRAFFSGHTSITATSSFFMAQVFADFHPNSKWKPVVWTSAGILPAIAGILRYTAGKHFPTDIVVGYAVGATIGVLVPHIHKKIQEKSE